jgi:hypothetical protein
MQQILTAPKVGADGTAELTVKERNAYDKGLVTLNAELLATLATLGRARQLEDGRWMG